MIYTSRYNYSGDGRLDITVKGNDPIGKIFAPTWNMVFKFKQNNNKTSYTERYHKLMLQSYKKYKSVWEDILSKDKVVLVCFCPKNSFCHRYLLADYLQKLGGKYCGEI